MVEGNRHVGSVEPRNEVHEARERREAATPAAAPALYAERQAGGKRVHSGRVGSGECDRRLREHERDVPLQAVAKSLATVCNLVAARSHVDVDVVAAHFDREAP